MFTIGNWVDAWHTRKSAKWWFSVQINYTVSLNIFWIMSGINSALENTHADSGSLTPFLKLE